MIKNTHDSEETTHANTEDSEETKISKVFIDANKK